MWSSLWAAFMLLSLAKEEVTSRSRSQYGCDFHALARSRPQSPLAGEFGDLDPSGILGFKNDKVYDKFYQKISKIFSEFKKNRDYSSLSSYLKFYKTYNAVKTCPGFQGFENFYRTYLMEKFPYAESGGNAVKLMEKLTSQIPEFVKSAYFVTRSRAPNEESLKGYDTTSVSLPGFFRHEQTAVVIKFRFDDKRVKGYRYILLDPEMPMDSPAVFLLDNGVKVSDVSYDKVQFNILEARGKPITDSQFMSATVRYGKEDEPMTYLYYFKKPYCSFVETTMKSSLLGFTHTREHFNDKGESHAKLMVNIGLDGERSFYDVSFLLYDGQTSKKVTIPLMNNMNQGIVAISDDLYKLCDRLGVRKGKCLISWAKKIRYLQAIHEDKTFLAESKKFLTTDDPAAPWVPEENSSWEVLMEVAPETKGKKKKSFKLPSTNMLWKVLEKAEHSFICKSYGYGNPIMKESVKKDTMKKESVKKDEMKKDPVKKDAMKKDPVKKDAMKKDPVKKNPKKVTAPSLKD